MMGSAYLRTKAVELSSVDSPLSSLALRVAKGSTPVDWF